MRGLGEEEHGERRVFTQWFKAGWKGGDVFGGGRERRMAEAFEPCFARGGVSDSFKAVGRATSLYAGHRGLSSSGAPGHQGC